MKKILAIVFALIFALSACTVAFAASYECDACHAILASQSALDAHNNGGCLIKFKACQYCGAKVETEYIELHEGECPKGAADCDYCGKENLANQNALAAHQATDKCEAKCPDCGVAVVYSAKDSHECEIADQVTNTVANIDWEAVLNEVIAFISDIDFDALVAEIEGIIAEVEALLADIDFDGILADVKGAFAA